LNDNSRQLIGFVVGYNQRRGATVCGYTFDAGPNCCVFIKETDVEDFLQEFNKTFSCVDAAKNGNHSAYKLPLKQYCVSCVGGGPSLI
jgi:diphosphomevalonate decarboxylase